MKTSLLLALASILLIFSSCNSHSTQESGTAAFAFRTDQFLGEQDEPTIRIAAIRGPTALGLLQLMHRHELGNTYNNYSFELVGSPEQIPPMLVQGNIDIAAVPANLASILYNRPDIDIQVLAIVTLGVLHVVDTFGDITSIACLAGRTIFVPGQGATPEFALNYILEKNGLTPHEDVYIEFRSEPAEIAALLETGRAQTALLPEPFVSTALARIDGLNLVLCLTYEWNRVQPDYGLIMSVVIGRRSFIDENPSALAVLLEEYAASINFMTTNITEAAELAAQFEIIPSVEVAKTALPRTNITFITGHTMKQNLMGFYTVLYNQSPQAVGGRLPDENAFFIP